MRKLTLDLDGTEVDHAPPALFERQVMTTGRDRIAVYVPDGQGDLFERVSASLPEPFYFLYVLHTPRGEAEPGRYQSTALSRVELNDFLTKYRSFFADDARHDLWVHSPTSSQTLIWDRHNKLFAEGEPLGVVVDILEERGFEEGALQPLGDHAHHYRSEYDDVAARLLAEFDWHWTSLRQEDVQ